MPTRLSYRLSVLTVSWTIRFSRDTATMTDALSPDYCTKFNKPKPPLPYIVGQEFWIRPHTPPPPMHGDRDLSYEGFIERETKHPLERCLLHPPLPGLTEGALIGVKVVEEVRVGDGHSAQLVTVKIIDVPPQASILLQQNMILVAKFYDPLYFNHKQDDMDPFLASDYGYTHETAAYKALESFQGNKIPKYYGSYTCELPTPSGHRRSVRLILIERIIGSSMEKLKPTDFSQSERQNIMKFIIDTESDMYGRDIVHTDLHPRNVIVSGSAADASTLRVVLIDFGYVRFGRLGRYPVPEQLRMYLPGVRISPILRWHKAWWDGRHSKFEAWIDWDWQPWLEHHWSKESVITPEMASVFLPSDFCKRSVSF